MGAKAKFNKYIQSLPTDGSAGDINQISASYISGGGLGQQAAQTFQDNQAQAAQLKAQQDLQALMAKQIAQKAAADAEARRQAQIMDERRKLLEAQRTVGGRKSSAGKGGLKLSGVKRTMKRNRSTLRRGLAERQRNMALQIAQQKPLNLG